MKNIQLTVTAPAKEVSELIELVESIGGTIQAMELQGVKKRRTTASGRKKPKFITRAIITKVLDYAKKHPNYTHAQLGKPFDISRASVGRILDGTASEVLKQRKESAKK